MSGRIQHYIPQSFLRGFLICQQSEQTLVYCKDRNYTSNINRVAAQRDFYSSPSDERGKTLDDIITNYEGRLGELLGRLRVAEIGTEVNASIAAEVIAHLSPRGKNIRRMFGNGTAKLIMGISDIFSDKEAVLSVIGLDEPAPNKIWNDHISSAFNDDSELTQLIKIITKQTSIPRKTLDRIFFMLSKENILGGTNSIHGQLQQIFPELISRIDDVVSNSHKEILNNGLVAEPRKKDLEELTWRIFPAPAEGAIMPDCIALGFDEEEGIFLPYIMASVISIVVMPLTSEKLLVGIRPDSTVSDLSNFNNEASECSDEFFISVSSIHANLSENIGKRSKSKMDSLVLDALSSLQINKKLENTDVFAVTPSPFAEYQLTFNNWPTEGDIPHVSGTVQSVVEKFRQSLDLTRLDGITFTSEFEKTLEETERGFDGNKSQEGVPYHIAQGVAALLVIRDGKLKVRIVLHQTYAKALVGNDIQDAVVALHFLVAGLSIVHTVNQFENTVPGFLMEPITVENHAAILHCAMRKALRAYRYASVSAEFGAEDLIEQVFSSYLTNAIDFSYTNIVRAKAEHKIDGNHGKLFNLTQNAVTDILIAMARFIGHLQGTGKATLPSLETSVGAAIATYQLAGWFSAFSYDMQQFWNKESWTREDLYALNIHVERLLWPHGIFLFQADDGLETMIFSL